MASIRLQRVAPSCVPDRLRDERTGRPLDEDGREAIASLSDDELEAELTIAASPPNGLRRGRYEALLREKARRTKLS